MRKNKENLGFTLAELMIWITIIWIMVLWITQIDINRLSENQELEIEVVKIVNIIEEARNNALIWKWIKTSLEIPDSWSVFINTTNQTLRSQWDITTPAENWTLSTWSTTNNFTIRNMRCQHLNGTVDTNTSDIVTIDYFWSRLDLRGCDDNTFKKLVFEYWVNDNFKTLSINTLTWVIERD